MERYIACPRPVSQVFSAIVWPPPSTCYRITHPSALRRPILPPLQDALVRACGCAAGLVLELEPAGSMRVCLWLSGLGLFSGWHEAWSCSAVGMRQGLVQRLA